MKRQPLHAHLDHWIREEGYRQIGEIAIHPRPDGGFTLCHWEDAGAPADLAETFDKPEAALQIGLYDDAGDYRALKTAPSLRHGWKMKLPDARALRQALDLFYPAMTGAFLAHREGTLRTTPMLGTMGRQTGMYQRVRGMTPDQGDQLCGQICPSQGGCLRTIRWQISPDHGQPRSQPPEKFDPAVNQTGAPHKAIPLLCFEVCNILVAKGREFLKTASE